VDRFGHPKYLNDTDVLANHEVEAVAGVEGALRPESRQSIKNQIGQLKNKLVGSIHSLSVNDDGAGSIKSGKRSNASLGKHYSDQQLSLLEGDDENL